MDKLTISRHLNGSTTFKIQMNGKGDNLASGSLEKIAEYLIIKHQKTARKLSDSFQYGLSLPDEIDFGNVDPSEKKELTRLVYVSMK